MVCNVLMGKTVKIKFYCTWREILANMENITNTETKSHIVFCLHPLEVLVKQCEFLRCNVPS